VPADSSITVVGTDEISMIRNSEIVVIAASIGTYTSSRIEILDEHVRLIKEISSNVQKHSPNSTIIMVTNPVDPLTTIFQKVTNWNPKKILGVASSLDSSRFQYVLAKELSVNPSEITGALVLGEHGDSMVPIFSVTKHNGKPILDCLDESQVNKVTNSLLGYWKILRQFKGPSLYGITKQTFDIMSAIIKNEEITVPASVLLNGEFGISNVCLGVPVRINKSGIAEVQEITLNGNELESLTLSANKIKKLTGIS